MPKYTPKEKAKELVDKYYNSYSSSSATKINYSQAIGFALIAVGEVLKVAFYAPDEIYDYWHEVKQEIEKL